MGWPHLGDLPTKLTNHEVGWSFKVYPINFMEVSQPGDTAADPHPCQVCLFDMLNESWHSTAICGSGGAPFFS